MSRQAKLFSRAQWPLAIVMSVGAFATQSRSPAQADEPQRAPASAPQANDSPEAPAPAPAPAASNSEGDGQLARLDAELSRVLEELVEARARAAFLAKRLFDTRLSVTLVRRADDQRLTHLRLSLDGTPVHDSDGQVLSGDKARLFDGAVAEGVHELTVELTEHAKIDATYSSTRSESFRLKLRRKTATEVEIILRDRSDLAEEAAEGDDGEYDVSTKVRVSSQDAGKR